MVARQCSVEGCDEELRCKGFCKLHYRRWKRSGDPGPPRVAAPDGHKRCTGCDAVKPISEFHRHPLGKYGHEARCKECKRLAYQAAAERIKARRRDRYAQDAEFRARRKTQRDAWNAANRDRISANGAAYRAAKPERIYVVQRAWRDANPGRSNEYARQWRQRHPAKARAVGRIHESARRAKIRAKFVEHVDHVTCYEMHGGICGICGQAIEPGEHYHIDHVIPLSRGGEHSYANTQPAHPRCNHVKRARVGFTLRQ